MSENFTYSNIQFWIIVVLVERIEIFASPIKWVNFSRMDPSRRGTGCRKYCTQLIILPYLRWGMLSVRAVWYAKIHRNETISGLTRICEQGVLYIGHLWDSKWPKRTVVRLFTVRYLAFVEWRSRSSIRTMLHMLNTKISYPYLSHNTHLLHSQVETVGDKYMAVSGLPETCRGHAKWIAKLALDMMDMAKCVKMGDEPMVSTNTTTTEQSQIRFTSGQHQRLFCVCLYSVFGSFNRHGKLMQRRKFD